MKTWIVATAILAVVGASLALPQGASPVEPASAGCDGNEIVCATGCWQPGNTACARGCVLHTCKNVRIE